MPLRIDGPVPDVVKPPPGNPHFPMFDGLRAVAAMSILFSHIFMLGGYNVFGTFGHWTAMLTAGVPLFFVISGFLLYRPFVAADMSGREPLSTGPYLRRRLLRIVPAYWVALTILSLFPYNAYVFDHWARYYLFLQIYFQPEQLGAGLAQAWSICAEMAFYFVLPIYALAMRRVQQAGGVKRRLQVELPLLVFLSVVSAFFYQQWSSGHITALNAGLPRFMYWFALGMSAALVSAWAAQHQDRKPKVLGWIADRPAACWAIAFGLYSAGAVLIKLDVAGMIAQGRSQMFYWVFAGAAMFFLVLPGVFGEVGRGLPSKVLMHKWLVWLGLVSYGIYLWQFKPFDWTSAKVWQHGWHFEIFGDKILGAMVMYGAIAIGFTIPVAALSYYIVEKPFLKLKFKKKTSQLTLSS